jgi:hypothetical protein
MLDCDIFDDGFDDDIYFVESLVGQAWRDGAKDRIRLVLGEATRLHRFGDEFACFSHAMVEGRGGWAKSVASAVRLCLNRKAAN